MGNFMGGSAYGMAQQISQGYILVTERTFKRFTKPELDKLSFELDKLMRETRADQPDLEDVQALQNRNRKISRINTAMVMLKSYRQRMK